MSTSMKILRYELSNVLRSRWVLVYTLLLLLLTDALFRFGGSGSRAILSLLNVVLILVPLVSVVFGTMYLYHSREFIELLLAQPVSRRSLYAGLYGGVVVPLCGAFLAGVGLPLIWGARGEAGIAGALVVLLGSGTLLTLVFTGLAFLVALRFEDRAKGLGLAILLWLVTGLLWDAFILFIVASFGEYPLETPVLALTMLNPVDLARILLLLQFDIAALMGYTGAVFERFFGSALGITLSVGALMVWTLVPAIWGARRFERKDF